MKALFVSMALCVAAASAAFGEEQAGWVVRHEGHVTVHRQGAMRGERLGTGRTELFVGDSLRTRRASRALVRFVGDSKAVVLAESLLRIIAIRELGAGDGQILFEIKKQRGIQGLRVKSKVALIGVKGTRFALTSSGEQLGVYLKEGALDIEAAEGEFKRYRSKGGERSKDPIEELNRQFEQDRERMDRKFEERIERMNREFEAAKNRMDQVFEGFVKRFELSAGTAVIIDGIEARDAEIPADIEEDLRLLDGF